ncbi:DUF3488 and transglutaminase-like domain-containing protein [Brachybacterium timonense]|uniref:DUF3488 and transglutaminase-like domain-containing protein n=1 Tax=Brachybacterium timonense TaxID=2050896 RepID=UPI000D0B8F6D|nr:DUF3488 and transglutaminase-like domain-containing protein [Brachybacterium timonense]
MSGIIGRPALTPGAATVRSLVLFMAILLASTPLTLLLKGDAWIVFPLLGATPVIAAGMLLRLRLRGTVIVPLLQILVILALLIIATYRQNLVPPDAVLGDLPTILGTTIVGGLSEFVAGKPPLVVGARGSVVLVLMIALITLALDLLAIDLSWHTPTALLLLGFSLLPVLQHPGGGPWWTIAGPVGAAMLLLAVRTVHADPEYLEGDQRPQARPLQRPLRTTLATLAVITLVALSAAPLGDRLPALAQTRIPLTIDQVKAWQGRQGAQLGAVMVDDSVSVRRALLDQGNTRVLSYTTDDADPGYLRLRTLTSFDGHTFQPGSGDAGQAMPASPSDSRQLGETALEGHDLATTRVQVAALGGHLLPVPGHVRSIRAEAPAAASPSPAGRPEKGTNGAPGQQAPEAQRPAGDGSHDTVDAPLATLGTSGEVARTDPGTTVAGMTYDVRHERPQIDVDALRAVDPAGLSDPLTSGYLSVGDLPEASTELASQIVESTGARGAYDTAMAFQEHFRTQFDYSVTVATPPGEDPLTSFLSEKVGYCEQFAATFALMMNSQGYPTRVAVGFTAGAPSGDGYVVTSKNAHAWPEVWFGPDYGWIPFEPTPADAANGVNAGPVPQTEPEQETPQAQEPTAADQPEEQPTSEARGDSADPEEPTTPAQAQHGSDVGEETPEAARWWGVALAVALLAAAGVVAWIQGRRAVARWREARWDAAARAGDAAVAELAWAEVEAAVRTRRRAVTWLGWLAAVRLPWGAVTWLGRLAAVPTRRRAVTWPAGLAAVRLPGGAGPAAGVGGGGSEEPSARSKGAGGTGRAEGSDGAGVESEESSARSMGAGRTRRAERSDGAGALERPAPCRRGGALRALMTGRWGRPAVAVELDPSLGPTTALHELVRQVRSAAAADGAARSGASRDGDSRAGGAERRAAGSGAVFPGRREHGGPTLGAGRLAAGGGKVAAAGAAEASEAARSGQVCWDAAAVAAQRVGVLVARARYAPVELSDGEDASAGADAERVDGIRRDVALLRDAIMRP